MFDAIISDIEMPGMNGFEFAEAVRGDPRWEKVPMVALSSHTSVLDVDRGLEAGFNAYVPKSDRQALVQSVADSLAASLDTGSTELESQGAVQTGAPGFPGTCETVSVDGVGHEI
jgi:CheY-like chemotaxis protein